RAPPVWSCPRPDRLARAGPTRAGPTRAAPLGWLRLAAVMGGTLVTHGGDIATACHQRPAHHAVRVQAGARDARRCGSRSLCGGGRGALSGAGRGPRCPMAGPTEGTARPFGRCRGDDAAHRVVA